MLGSTCSLFSAPTECWPLVLVKKSVRWKKFRRVGLVLARGQQRRVGGGIVGFRDNQVHAREFCPTYTILGYGFEVSF